MSQAVQSNSGTTDINKFPPQIKYIVSQEACERYSFYGMKSILTIFMVQYLLFQKSEAVSILHFFSAAAYLTPLLGGYISDRFWGKYRTILTLSLLYVVGHGVLAIWEGTAMGLYVGLALIALGAGGIKPCVSAHVGDQFTKKNQHMIKKVFALFYWLINFGSFFSTMLTPWVLAKYGAAWAFGIPGILMAIATFIFWRGHKYYVHVPPTGKNPHSTMRVLFSALKNKTAGVRFLDGALKDHPPAIVDGVRAALSVGKTLIPITFFWACFHQHSSTWILQAKEMNLNFLGFEFLPSQIAALNPAMIMMFIPILVMFGYPTFERMGVVLTPLRKMGAGMALTGFSFILIAIYQYILDGGTQLNDAGIFSHTQS